MPREGNWLRGIKPQLATFAITAVVTLSILALVGMLFVATLLLIPADGRPTIPFSASNPAPVGSSDVTELGPDLDWDKTINVAFVLRRLNPSESQLAGILTLAVPEGIVSKMHIKGDAICVKKRGAPHVLRRPFRSARLIITIRASEGLARQHVAIPLAKLLANYNGNDYRAEIPINVITVSNSSAYPLDYYILDAQLDADWSPNSEGVGVGAKLPVDSWLQAAAGMAGNKVSFNRNDDEAGFQVLIERDSITKFYVLILATSPLLLLFVMIHQAYQAIRNESGPSSTIPLEAVVGLIAIVPLRQVLVPNSIPGLTTIDVILGAELVLFVAVVTIASFWPVLRGLRRPAGG